MPARRLLGLAAVVAAVAAAACGGDGGPATTGAPPATGASSPSPTATPTPSPTPSPSVSPGASPSPTPGPSPSPTPTVVTYTVQAGDTLYSIARRFGATVDAIVAANGLSDPNSIYVGQVLLIPAGPLPSVTPTPPAGYAQVIRKGDASRMMVAFSFDAGADAGFTAQILDTLKANGIKASFGITGRWAEQNPDLLKRIVQEGHSLINHSYDHPSFTGYSTGKPPLTQAQRWEQLDKTENLVKELTGASTKPYFRPPYGDYDDSVNADIYAPGYRYNVMWTVDSRGWQGLSASEIRERCLGLAEPGAIYVFHVGSASQDAAALSGIIEGLQEKGYSIGSVPDVIAP